MPTSWKRADDNVLRAHLQEALAQRIATKDVDDWSYSDYEIAVIRAELNERRAAHAALRCGVPHASVSAASPVGERDLADESQSTVDAEAARLRMLIARCFKPSRRPGEQRLAVASRAKAHAIDESRRPSNDAVPFRHSR